MPGEQPTLTDQPSKASPRTGLSAEGASLDGFPTQQDGSPALDEQPFDGLSSIHNFHGATQGAQVFFRGVDP